MIDRELSRLITTWNREDQAQADSWLQRVWKDSAWAERYKNAKRLQSFKRLATPLVETLERRLGSFERSLSLFRWPDIDRPWKNARLVSTREALGDKVNVQFQDGSLTGSRYTHYTRGLDSLTPSGLKKDTYDFTIHLGEKSRRIAVSLSDDMSWKDVLRKVESTVNSCTPAVEAEVIRQYSPFEKVAGVPGVGWLLLIKAASADEEKPIRFQDGDQGLLRRIGLKEMSRDVVGAAAINRYDLKGQGESQPSSYLSMPLDPNEESGLSGIFNFTMTLEDQKYKVRMELEENQTWGDVLGSLAGLINSEQSLARAEILGMDRPAYINGKRYRADAKGLSVTLLSPKKGERLVMEDGEGGLLAAIGLDMTAVPGRDGQLTVNGRSRESGDSLFSLDRGLIRLELKDTYGQPLPLRVVEALEEVESRLGDVVAGYNSLKRFLSSGESFWQEGISDFWTRPIDTNRKDLEWLGVIEWGDQELIWIDRQKFWKALGQDPYRVKRALVEDTGVIPQWKERVTFMKNTGLENFLASLSSLQNLSRSSEQELNLEKGSSFLDLFS